MFLSLEYAVPCNLRKSIIGSNHMLSRKDDTNYGYVGRNQRLFGNAADVVP